MATIDPSSNDRNWLALSDEALLADCRFDAFRGSGPGGQHRNKTSTSIRLTHIPTGVQAVAENSRSQAQNKSLAVRRLKLALATEIRRPVDAHNFPMPGWLTEVIHAGRLGASEQNIRYAQTAALVLDLLEARRGGVGEVAMVLGVTTSSIVKFLENEPAFWTAANRIRARAGQAPLQGRK